MKKAEKIERVKELLNEVLILVDDSNNEFLSSVKDAVDPLVNPPDEEYHSSEKYYDSTC